MTTGRNNELVFEVTQEADGGYVAECMTESIVTQGDTWEELRAMVIDAVDAYFFDGAKPQAIRLHLVRNEVVLMK
ncbi:MAG: 2-phospho-L-lactate guanylyltransferase [Candidatus Acidiferrum sp.]|jgi:predicted RNase H-like HicB family nuclease